MVVELLKTCLDMNRFEEMWKEALFRDAILLADLCVSACVVTQRSCSDAVGQSFPDAVCLYLVILQTLIQVKIL